MLQRNRYQRSGSIIDWLAFQRAIALPESVTLCCISRCSREARRCGRQEMKRTATLLLTAFRAVRDSYT